MATAEASEATVEYDAVTKEIGDKIVGLTLLEAKKLADYLENVHGIKPAAGGAVMMAASQMVAGEPLPSKSKPNSRWS